MTRAHFKFLAKQQLKGKVGVLFLATLLFCLVLFGSLLVAGALMAILSETLEQAGAIIGAVICIAVVIFIDFFAVPAFAVGWIRMLQSIARNPEVRPSAKEIFSGFKYSWGAFKVLFFTGLFTYLWSLLFVIPGLIKAYSYSQALYIYAENPEIGALEAITRSRQMMHGRKFDFVVLLYSFFPWMILLPYTLGILGIWLYPYMDLTRINFYNNIKNVPGHPDYGFPTYGKVIPASAYMPAFRQYSDATEAPKETTPNYDVPSFDSPIFDTPTQETPAVEAPVEAPARDIVESDQDNYEKQPEAEAPVEIPAEIPEEANEEEAFVKQPDTPEEIAEPVTAEASDEVNEEEAFIKQPETPEEIAEPVTAEASDEVSEEEAFVKQPDEPVTEEAPDEADDGSAQE